MKKLFAILLLLGITLYSIDVFSQSYKVTIMGDMNDADYVIKKSTLNKEELKQLEYIISITGPNWSNRIKYDGPFLATNVYKDTLREDDFELMNRVLPKGELGINYIKYIKVEQGHFRDYYILQTY
jgi:hypothetical protein